MRIRPAVVFAVSLARKGVITTGGHMHKTYIMITSPKWSLLI